MKTRELVGPELDYAASKVLGVEYRFMASTGGDYNGNWWWEKRRYSTDWSKGGPLLGIMAEGGQFLLASSAEVHQATYIREANIWTVYGPSALVAIVRCFVLSKLGEIVDIPGDLT